MLRETWFKLVTDPCAVVRGNCASSVLGLQIVTASSYQIWLLVSFFFWLIRRLLLDPCGHDRTLLASIPLCIHATSIRR